MFKRLKEKKYLKEIEPLVEKEMLENGLWRKDSTGKIEHAQGSVHVAWEIRKRLMKEKFGYDWKSPQDKNPNMHFD